MTSIYLADESLGWLVLSVGGMVIGLIGLMARRSSSGGWRWAVAALLLAVAAAGWALEWQASILIALLGLTSFQALQAGCTFEGVQRAGARLARWVLVPRGQASVLLAAMAAVAIWQVVRLDRAFQADIDQADGMFQALLDAEGLSDTPARVASTDKGRLVSLFTTVGLDLIEAKAEREHIRRKGLELNLIQTSSADFTYNCHGWLFTGGRFWVRGEEVLHILKENGYKRQARPAPDDLAVFRDSKGQVVHSALVRSVTPDGMVLLESKWGQLGRFLHNDKRHVYREGACLYYRSERSGHLLRGLEGSPLASNQVTSQR